MERTLLKSKIHRATVTDAELDYEGSVTLDPELMEAADLVAHERVEIYNVTNGERFATYVIPGERHSGDVVINGAAAHKAKPRDVVIVCSYVGVPEERLGEHRPRLVYVDAANRIVERRSAERLPAGSAAG